MLFTSLFDDVLNMRDHIITNLIRIGCLGWSHQSNQRSWKSFIHFFLKEWITSSNVQKDLHCSQQHWTRSMLQSTFQKIHNVKIQVLIRWSKASNKFQNNALSPLIKILNSIQKINNYFWIDFESPGSFLNLIYCLNCINDYVRIRIFHKTMQLFNKISRFEFFLWVFIHLDTANDCCFSNIRIKVIKAILNGLLTILSRVIELELT